MKCPSCQAETQDGDEFCRACGKSLRQLEVTPNAISIHEMGEKKDQSYGGIPLMPGGDVEDLIKKTPHHKMPFDKIIKIAGYICKKLRFAHSKSVIIISPDNKQDNIWISARSYVEERLLTGIPEFEIIDDLVRRGFEKLEALRFVRRVETEKPQFIFKTERKIGLVFLVLGIIIVTVEVILFIDMYSEVTRGGWRVYWLSPFDILALIPGILLGIVLAGMGINQLISNTETMRMRLIIVGTGIFVVIGIITGVVAINNTINNTLLPPSDSFIVINDRTRWESEESGIVKISGNIYNAHEEWAIKNVQVVVDCGPFRAVINNSPSIIAPGERWYYYGTMQAIPKIFKNHEDNIKVSVTWDWVRP